MLSTVLASCSGQSTKSEAKDNPQPQAGTSGLLARVKSRGKLICGTSGKAPGFSFVDSQGNYSGLDVDICRAVAAAVFNDPQKVEFHNLSIAQRFTALQTGEVDLLSETATWTITRQASVGVDFAPIVLYDGQGMMVKKASGIQDLKGLDGKSICVQTGTTTEENLADQMRKQSLKYKSIVFGDRNATFAAYEQGRCEGVTADRSSLVVGRAKLPNPEDNVILKAVLSKEPLAPGVKQGDPQWSNVVRWVVFALIQAEESDISSKNVDRVVQSTTDPEVRRFLGKEGNLGQDLGLSNDFTVQVIKQVGNYGEIYDRNFGPSTPFKLARGQNNLWTKGGLLYSPPFR